MWRNIGCFVLLFAVGTLLVAVLGLACKSLGL